MGGMGLIFTPALVRHLLRPSSLVWAYDQYFLDSYVATPNSPNGRVNPPPASHLPPPPNPPTHPFIRAIRDITVVVKKVAQNPKVLASYYR